MFNRQPLSENNDLNNEELSKVYGENEWIITIKNTIDQNDNTVNQFENVNFQNYNEANEEPENTQYDEQLVYRDELQPHKTIL